MNYSFTHTYYNIYLHTQAADAPPFYAELHVEHALYGDANAALRVHALPCRPDRRIVPAAAQVNWLRMACPRASVRFLDREPTQTDEIANNHLHFVIHSRSMRALLHETEEEDWDVSKMSNFND